jgi:hypothetical protein
MQVKGGRESAETIKIEGNLEGMSVGAMVEIIKNEIAEVLRPPCRIIGTTITPSRTSTTRRHSNSRPKIKISIPKYRNCSANITHSSRRNPPRARRKKRIRKIASRTMSEKKLGRTTMVLWELTVVKSTKAWAPET